MGKPLTVANADEARKVQERLNMRFTGYGGIEVHQAAGAVSIGLRERQPANVGGGGGVQVRRAKIVSVPTNPAVLYTAKFVDWQDPPQFIPDAVAFDVGAFCYPLTKADGMTPVPWADYRPAYNTTTKSLLPVFLLRDDEGAEHWYALFPFIGTGCE